LVPFSTLSLPLRFYAAPSQIQGFCVTVLGIFEVAFERTPAGTREFPFYRTNGWALAHENSLFVCVCIQTLITSFILFFTMKICANVRYSNMHQPWKFQSNRARTLCNFL